MKAVIAWGLVPMAWAIAVLRTQDAALETVEAEESPCNGQCRFDIMMCKSFMCTECTYGARRHARRSRQTSLVCVAQIGLRPEVPSAMASSRAREN
eukprot:symbB.v1.2.025566.t1/scaffold2413.1/size174923/7